MHWAPNWKHSELLVHITTAAHPGSVRQVYFPTNGKGHTLDQVLTDVRLSQLVSEPRQILQSYVQIISCDLTSLALNILNYPESYNFVNGLMSTSHLSYWDFLLILLKKQLPVMWIPWWMFITKPYNKKEQSLRLWNMIVPSTCNNEAISAWNHMRGMIKVTFAWIMSRVYDYGIW